MTVSDYEGLDEVDSFEEPYDPYCGMCEWAYDYDLFSIDLLEDLERRQFAEAQEAIAESLKPDWADEVADRLEGPRKPKKQYF